MEAKIIQGTIGIKELEEMAKEEFGDIVKAVVDIGQGIMAVGGELHADEEVLLSEERRSKRQDTWGINLYPKKFPSDDWIEFDSMVNIKPSHNNSSRGVESGEIKEKIRQIVKKIVNT